MSSDEPELYADVYEVDFTVDIGTRMSSTRSLIVPPTSWVCGDFKTQIDKFWLDRAGASIFHLHSGVESQLT